MIDFKPERMAFDIANFGQNSMIDESNLKRWAQSKYNNEDSNEDINFHTVFKVMKIVIGADVQAQGLTTSEFLQFMEPRLE